MAALLATVCRVADMSFPIWVELRFADASGNEHVVIEKVPVLFSGEFDIATLPTAGAIPCSVLRTRADPVAGEVAEIDISEPYGVESIDGQTRFEVPCTMLCMFCSRCGGLLVQASGGESRCLGTNALLSSQMTRTLRDRFVFARAPQSTLPQRPDLGAAWFCPGCGGSLENGVCQRCAASLADLVYPLVEFNPHP